MVAAPCFMPSPKDVLKIRNFVIQIRIGFHHFKISSPLGRIAPATQHCILQKIAHKMQNTYMTRETRKPTVNLPKVKSKLR